MKNAEVAEAWMKGKYAQGSNFHSDGRTLWSYGWYPIAFKAKVNGKTEYFYSAERYSVTTSRHQDHARRVLFTESVFILENRDNFMELFNKGPILTEEDIKETKTKEGAFINKRYAEQFAKVRPKLSKKLKHLFRSYTSFLKNYQVPNVLKDFPELQILHSSYLLSE